MPKISFLVFALFLCAGVKAQSFPQSFIGRWQGRLTWFQAGKKEPQRVPMQLTIQPADTAGQYTWRLVYGEGGNDNRPYILKPVDTARGHWRIDERNGIVLDQYWLGGKFCGAFIVQSSTIVNNYWREGDKLIVEFFSLTAKPIITTGKGNDESPFVDGYAVKGYQRAVLRRKK